MILNFFPIEEDVLELLIVETFIASLIVFGNHQLDLGQSHLLAKLLHSEYNVLRSDEAGVVRVKLLEDSFQF